MPRKPIKEYEKITIRIWKEDLDKLRRIYSRSIHRGHKGYATAIRDIVHIMLKEHEKRVQAIVNQTMDEEAEAGPRNNPTLVPADLDLNLEDDDND